MPSLMNGKTEDNIISNIDDFIDKVEAKGSGLIAGTRFHTNHTYYDLSDATVRADQDGDDMYMVNCQNGISWETTTREDLRPTLIRYLNTAINKHRSSKATVFVTYNSATDLYELDNMRMYTSLEEAKRNGYANRSDYIHSIATGRDIAI